MRQFGYLEAIIKSFYSRDLYRDVALNWGSNVLLYLIILLAIVWACLMVGIQQQINKSYLYIESQYLPQIPSMEIQSGILSTPLNKPYLIHDENNKTIVIIDTTDQYNSLENTTAFLLVKKDGYIEANSNSQKIVKFNKNFNFKLDLEKINPLFKKVVHYSWVILFPMLLFLSLLFRIIKAAIFGLFGELFSIITHRLLTYGQVFRLAIVAMTPALILDTVFDIFHITLSYEGLLTIVITLCYLFFAVMCTPKKEG